jgi:hypothetical protein
MATATNIIVGLFFLLYSAAAFGVPVPEIFMAVVALLAGIACLAYPWITRQ